jgi:hypothetical protein
MWSRVRTLALLGVVATAALLPLYGDPRQSPVTHTEWARLVLRGIALLEATERLGGEASQAFQVLSWKNSFVYPADRYLGSRGTEVERAGDARRVRATEVVGELTYPVVIVRGGEYRFRLHLAGKPEQPAEAEIARAGEQAPLKMFRVAPGPAPGWADAGSVHLDPGAYTVAVLLPHRAALEFVELAPPCLSPIEPLRGWKATEVASTEDVAVTVLQAVELEHELAPAEAPTERVASDFDLEGQALAAAGLEALELRAGPRGVRAHGVIEVPRRGLYTLSVFGELGGGQSWLTDACRKSVLCPRPLAGAGWRPLLTAEFTAGRHFLSGTLAEGASLGRVRLERKKASGADYVAALRRLGFDPGPEGPITREKAIEAMRFLERRRLGALALCGDIVIPGPPPPGAVLVAQAQPPGQGGEAGGAPQPPGPGGPTEPPIGSPVLPPQQVMSPVRP